MKIRPSHNTLTHFALLALLALTAASCAAAGRAQPAKQAPALHEPGVTSEESASEARTTQSAGTKLKSPDSATREDTREDQPPDTPSHTPTSPKPTLGGGLGTDGSLHEEGAGGAGIGRDAADDPRRLVEGLIQGIERRSDQYREEFGIENFSPQAPESCDEVCDLSKAICQSSKKICEISQVQSQDPWFSERCRWSSKQCDGASTQCDTCSR